jgi:hypothetical protein
MSLPRCLLSATALVCAASFATPSLGAAATVAAPTHEAKPLVEKVHFRRWRHCHENRWGDRRCHGRAGYRYYDGGPGIYLRLGRRHRHHHHYWD